MPEWKPPRSVSDGQNVWRVRTVRHIPGASRAKNLEVFGQTNVGKMVMHLRADLDPQRMEQVFWHEVVHVLFSSMGVDNENEGHVDALGAALQRFMRSNPQLLRSYLRGQGGS